ncbi:UDP-N-acetylmuramoyl-L-alanyl-D-glutamate--L-lysi ne ligase [Alkalibacterium iburiense]|uniref:UDP-N-acetylmuramoyl-L-alanyl-D-glutamate--L-lysine ligase n=1 Tax=Alkalibacterium iburiense TaxID=290589 RepID=A0ABN0XST9_9LACT
MYSISIQRIQSILFEQGLLREIVSDNDWLFQIEESKQLNKQFTQLSYNSKDTDTSTLFFCKGATFKQAYLEDAIKKGVEYYVSEVVYDIPGSTAIIVSDIRKAMPLVAREFYGFPDKKIDMVGITGTKGKTTTTFFVYSILDQYAPAKTAVISTMGITLDGQNWIEAQLTTPESLDLFKMIAQAVKNGMKHLVMEVSSQAFKMNRVLGLYFDIGVFLNISPDHIGPNEHPTMEDYFYCKRQLLNVSETVILNSQSDYFELLKEQASHYSKKVLTYGTSSETADYWYKDVENHPKMFNIHSPDSIIDGTYTIAIPGDFNKENALCAAIISSELNVPKESIQKGLDDAVIPGRMEHVAFNESNHVYVDFAHNYISLKSVLDYVIKEHPENDLTIVLGAPGGKGVSRRKDFGELLSEYVGKVILTADDPNEEDPRKISEEIKQHIKGPLSVAIIDDRKEAIEYALENADSNETIVIAGKGNDDFIYIDKVKEPYIGDMPIVENYIWRNGI